MNRYSMLRNRYASACVERARLSILQFDKSRSCADYDKLFSAIEHDLVRYKRAELPIVAVGKGSRLQFLSHKESMCVLESMLCEIKHIRNVIAFNIWIHENNIRVI